MAHKSELPEVITENPRDLIDIVMGAWDCDGRKKGGVKSEDIALAIQQKIGRPFDRNKFNLLRVEKRQPDGSYYRQFPKPDVLKAFFEVAFELWDEDGPRSYNPPIDLEKVIRHACEAIANYDWSGRKSDLSALVSAIAETASPITLEDIEWLVENRIHLQSPLTFDLISQTLATRRKSN
ncbi:MAG: hypothetical protein ABIS69_00920 [Sediminibacterium sp.]